MVPERKRTVSAHAFYELDQLSIRPPTCRRFRIQHLVVGSKNSLSVQNDSYENKVSGAT